MNNLMTLANQGYTSEEILQAIIRRFPMVRKKAIKALNAGYPAEKIVGYLFGGRQEIAEPVTDYEKTNANVKQNREQARNRTMAALAVAGGLGATALEAQAANAAIRPSAILPAQKNILSQPPIPKQIPAIAQQIGYQGPATQTPSIAPQGTPPSPQAVPIASIATPQSNVQPQQPLIQSKQPNVLEKYPNILQSVNNLASTRNVKGVNSPSDIAGFLKRFSLPEVKKIEKETAQPIEKVIQDYLSQQSKNVQPESTTNQLPKPTNLVEKPQEVTNAPAKLQASQQPTKEVLPEPSKPEKKEESAEAKPIAKKDIVASPHGIGEVVAIQNGKALIDVDDKKHSIDEDELETSPLPEKDLSDLYDELNRGIEQETGEEISKMVDFAGYDPVKNTLAFLPYTGALYVYEDISPEDASLLRNVLNVRKTSGENFIGVWKAGSKSPIGSAMSALIKRLQSERGGKGKEYSHKFETIYKTQEPAILAKKKKKAEEDKKKREEERRKKREKT